MTIAMKVDGRALLGAVLAGLVTVSCGHASPSTPAPRAPAPPVARVEPPPFVPPPPPAPPRKAAAQTSPEPAAPPATALQPGAIEMIQQRLESAGALPAEAATGHLDAVTRAALERFQGANALPVTGEPDAETVRKLSLDPRRIFEAPLGSE
jgi:hypothetical protein